MAITIDNEGIKVNGVIKVGLNTKTELENRANISGDATKRFKVANAVNDDEAVNKGQLDNKTNNPLAMPLNYNAFMHDLGNGPLEGWGARGSVTIEAVSPLTKAFEGVYTATKPSNAVDNEDIAGADAPFWFGVHNKGPRVRRGGLYDGWGALPGGHILKIYKPAGEAHSYNNSCMFQMIETFKRRIFNFRAYVYVAKGPLSFDLGHTDDGGQINIPSANEWHFIDVINYQTEVCSTYMNINIDHAEECELYIAMMNIIPVTGTGNHSTIINRRIK